MSRRLEQKNKMEKEKRQRDFCFTCNNYKDLHIKMLQSLKCKYIIYGKEVAPETGTPHLQGYVYFFDAKTQSAAKKCLKGCHVEFRMASDLDDAIDYCRKEGEVYERGEKPMSQKKKGQKGAEYWSEQLGIIKTGKLDEVDPQLLITHARNIDYIYNKTLNMRVLTDTTEKHEWYYGETGTGKSRKARTENPDAYLKIADTKWWDGYTNQETVIIEDFDKYHIKQSYNLKIWADRYPFPAEVKGSQIKIRPKKIIVTSNYHPDQIWTDSKDLDPILRRFKVIRFEKEKEKNLNYYPIFLPQEVLDERLITDELIPYQIDSDLEEDSE